MAGARSSCGAFKDLSFAFQDWKYAPIKDKWKEKVQKNIACRRQVLSREQESTRVEQVKTIAKESAFEVEEEDKILGKKVGKYKESGREEWEKIIVKNVGKQNETELEWIDKGNAKEKYKGKENDSKITTWWQKVLC